MARVKKSKTELAIRALEREINFTEEHIDKLSGRHSWWNGTWRLSRNISYLAEAVTIDALGVSSELAKYVVRGAKAKAYAKQLDGLLGAEWQLLKAKAREWDAVNKNNLKVLKSIANLKDKIPDDKTARQELYKSLRAAEDMAKTLVEALKSDPKN